MYDYTQVVGTTDHNESVAVLFFGSMATHRVRVLHALNAYVTVSYSSLEHNRYALSVR